MPGENFLSPQTVTLLLYPCNASTF